MDLVEFLRARLDEREGGLDDAQWGDAQGTCYECGTNRDQVLREVEAKRVIVKWHPREPMRYIDADRCPQCELTWPCPTIRHLAAVYSDHPDYDEAWKP